LFDTEVLVDGVVYRSTGEVLALPVGDVKVDLGIWEFLCETEIDDLDLDPSSLVNTGNL